MQRDLVAKSGEKVFVALLAQGFRFNSASMDFRVVLGKRNLTWSVPLTNDYVTKCF